MFLTNRLQTPLTYHMMEDKKLKKEVHIHQLYIHQYILLFRRNAICSFVSTWRLKMIYFLQIVLEEKPGHLPKL